ncbi:unnamed protein product [Penicillium nalgiovense]|uniref:Uncharacterized protein n=1 Tax=Penicillium nalgiovense TaxID=60175 RepID=A0A9W4MRT8_PENNA|nr:unnamed protein product [Penicillium nalgiovense]CAG8025685.1 unnamed protein product [Penicillium nalgiovense]CAG8039373.1 unnamed protein product [Penicillium nalgiovense]CAG8055667.1 unnamed protein product [Penicillium nalgiovense]CAG8059810.1 unnamed protein product [Penicillium nalgiovense]
MISEANLKISAQTSLKALQIWSLGTLDLGNAVERQYKLDPEIASLVVACQHLRKNGYREGRARLAQNSILNRHVQAMVEDLTDNSLKIFALLTWHFNADFSVALPRQLLQFFNEPSKIFEDVCTDIHRRYTTMAEPESIKSFKRRFIRLLGWNIMCLRGNGFYIFKYSDYVIIVAAICQ